jgi:hypothetical protein
MRTNLNISGVDATSLSHGVGLGIEHARRKGEHFLLFLEGSLCSFLPRMLQIWIIGAHSPKSNLAMPHCAWLVIPLLKVL